MDRDWETTKQTDLEKKYNEALKTSNELQERLVMSKYNDVPEDFASDFKTLVKANVTDEKTFEQAAEEVHERLNITQKNNKIIIGGKKSIAPITTKEQLEALRKLQEELNNGKYN